MPYFWQSCMSWTSILCRGTTNITVLPEITESVWSLVSLVWLWNLVARRDQAGELVSSCPSPLERRTASALSHSGQGLSLKCQPWKHHFKTNRLESIQQPGNLWARLVGLDGWASRSHRSTWQLPGRPPPWPFLSQSGKVACDSSA